uniref:Uncharacterized protein n=1 Tax=Seriola lalandi dorsalis TaxID=1841481 RepID=A0A3B4XHM8_SERLL
DDLICSCFPPEARTQKENLNRAVTVPTVKHGGGSELIWGYVSTKAVGEMTFIDGTMKATRQDTLNESHKKRNKCLTIDKSREV